MATTARIKQTIVSKTVTKTEASVTPAPAKASFWSRAKAVVISTAKRVGRAIAAPFKAFAGKDSEFNEAVAALTACDFVPVTRAQRFAVSIARAYVSVRRVVRRAWTIARRVWTIALRPFLQGVASVLAIAVLVIGSFIAPVTTAVTLLVVGFVFVGLSRGVHVLEQSDARIARITLRVLEIVGRTLQVLSYVGAAFVTAALCVASIPFTAYTALMLVLGYFDVRGAHTIAFLAWCVLSGSWLFGLLWSIWHVSQQIDFARADETVATVQHEDVQLIPASQGLQAPHVPVGAEEVAEILDEASWDQTHTNERACDACGTHKGALRVRSNALLFITGGSGAGKETTPSTDMLCSACYDLECDDNAIAMTGVSLRKRSCDVVLNAVGRATLAEFVSSKNNVTNVYWATTAWWRDRRGNHHERQWDCFHNGKIVATVVYDHSRKVYRASSFGKFIGTKTALVAAKALASDMLFDEGNAAERLLDALGYGAADVRPSSPAHAVDLGLLPRTSP